MSRLSKQWEEIFGMEATDPENIHFKKFKAIWKNIDKSQNITTLTFELNFWLQQKAAKMCEDRQDILAPDEEQSKPLFIGNDYKETILHGNTKPLFLFDNLFTYLHTHTL